jgi:membrane associated rhomboid family serine protease
MMNMTETVKQLLIINILFFVGTYLVGEEVVYRVLALQSPLNDNFKPWQPLTHMFMHGGLMHILFNMFALVSFGNLLEHIWGARKFLFFYISCGLGAAALHIGANYFEIQSLLDNASSLNLSQDAIHSIINLNFRDVQAFEQEALNIIRTEGKMGLVDQVNLQSLYDAAVVNQVPAVGASGAIYGLLVAFAFIAPNAELMLMFIPVPIKAKYFVPGLVAIDLFLGLKGQSLFGSGSGIAHFAHIGGALVGFIMMWYWKKNSYNNKRWN